MGLKFEHTDNLDKLFDSFAIDPKKVKPPKDEQKAKTEKTEQKKPEK